MRQSRGKRPLSSDATVVESPSAQRRSDPNAEHPKFCLAFIQKDFDVKSLPETKRADLAVSLQERASLTWDQIAKTDRHGQGYEHLPAKKFPTPPTQFSDRDQFMVFRYSGNLPMVGVRIGDVFHILWIERKFGELYKH